MYAFIEDYQFGRGMSPPRPKLLCSWINRQSGCLICSNKAHYVNFDTITFMSERYNRKHSFPICIELPLSPWIYQKLCMSFSCLRLCLPFDNGISNLWLFQIGTINYEALNLSSILKIGYVWLFELARLMSLMSIENIDSSDKISGNEHRGIKRWLE